MQVSLGIVVSASTSTGARATSNLTDPTLPCPGQAIGFQALPGNTGIVYICDRAAPTLTGAAMGVHVEIPAPSSSAATGSRPMWTAGNPSAPNAVDAREYYILPTVQGEGVRITLLRS
jgi:hypothetical protein